MSVFIAGLSYDPSPPFDGNNVDWVEIAIDTTMDYTFGPGDWRLVMPIGLSATEASLGQRVMDLEGWDMRPMFGSD
jgi:hypothetical protein